MASVSENIVREFFELHGFLVRQQRKYTSRAQHDEEESADFLVVNPRVQAAAASALPFVLGAEDLPRVVRAVVVVKGWHTETFSSGRLAQAPQIFRFLGPAVLKQAQRALGGEGELTKILVVPALPQGEEQRRQSIAVMQANGVDATIPFRTILAGLIAQVEVNRDYRKSDLLQTIRILKNYDFLRDPQLELFKPRRRAASGESGTN